MNVLTGTVCAKSAQPSTTGHLRGRAADRDSKMGAERAAGPHSAPALLGRDLRGLSGELLEGLGSIVGKSFGVFGSSLGLLDGSWRALAAC